MDRVRDRSDHPFSDAAASSQMHREFARANIDERHVLVNGETAQQTADTIFDLLPLRRFEWTL